MIGRDRPTPGQSPAQPEPIEVLVVDDSALVRQRLTSIIMTQQLKCARIAANLPWSTSTIRKLNAARPRELRERSFVLSPVYLFRSIFAVSDCCNVAE